MLTRQAFLRNLDAAKVEAAIRRAEARTSGEIRVSIAGFFHGNARRLGERAFRRLGMAATRHGNGVLIFIAPARRRLAILGGAGIHSQVGQAFWTTLAESLQAKLRAGDFTEGLVQAIDRVGLELASHFPLDPGDAVNELPDTVDVG